MQHKCCAPPYVQTPTGSNGAFGGPESPTSFGSPAHSMPPGTASTRMGTAMRLGTGATDGTVSGCHAPACTREFDALMLGHCMLASAAGVFTKWVTGDISLPFAKCFLKGQICPHTEHILLLSSPLLRLQARPMTSNRGAGFSSNPQAKFDPLSQGQKGALGTSSSILPKKQEASPDEVGCSHRMYCSRETYCTCIV